MSQDTVFRVVGVPAPLTIAELQTAFCEEFGDQATIDLKKSTLCPSCFSDGTQVALVQFTSEPPKELGTLKAGQPYEMELEDGDISLDKDFFGLTQLYPTSGPIVADVVAVCGLNRHAYGSWRGRGKLRRMWLRHYFSQDIPNYRTMIYGYNSNLTAHAIHTTQDYSKGFLEELIKARKTEQEKRRPLIFIGHGFGGVIIVQSLVRAKESEPGSDQSHIFPSTYATIFFGTPHRGLVVDDIRASLEEESSRHALLDSIEKGAGLLEAELSRFIDYCSDIRIVNFYETGQTRKLVRDANGKLSRSGDYFTAVESQSAVLQLPRKIAESLPAEGDHSTMVKFSNKTTSNSYTSVLKHLRNLATANGGNRFLTAYAAVLGKDAEALRHILIARPAVVNEKQKNGTTTLLHLAVEDGGDEEVITTLLEHQAILDSVDAKRKTPLYLAASKGYAGVVETLVKNGADVNAVWEGMTALHIATIGGHKDVILQILHLEADKEASVDDDDGFTALHLAARSGNIELVSTLLACGTNIEANGKDEDTPLHCAAWGGHETIIEFLIQHSADITQRGINGDTALHFAACQGHLAAMEMLIGKGADIHACNSSGHTVLHVAAGIGFVAAVKLLLLHEPNLSAVDDDLNTPLHFAAQNGHGGVVELLLEKNRTITEKTDINGYTALHSAAWGGHTDVVKILLRHGAKTEAKERVN